MVPDSEIYILDGVELPSPSAADVSWEDVHDQKSGRTQDARMHIFRIARKRKVALKYDVLTQKEMAELQRLLDRDYYQFQYFDPLYGVHQIEVYIPSAQQSLYSVILYNGLWRNVSFSLIEV